MLTRNTKTYQSVVDVFSSHATPLSIYDVNNKVKKLHPNTAFSTVYRIVNKLISTGKLKKIDWRDRGSKYEWAALEHHHHLICNNCGSIEDVNDKTINFDVEKTSTNTGFKIMDHSIELYGECGDCQK